MHSVTTTKFMELFEVHRPFGELRTFFNYITIFHPKLVSYRDNIFFAMFPGVCKDKLLPIFTNHTLVVSLYFFPILFHQEHVIFFHFLIFSNFQIVLGTNTIFNIILSFKADVNNFLSTSTFKNFSSRWTCDNFSVRIFSRYDSRHFREYGFAFWITRF